MGPGTAHLVCAEDNAPPEAAILGDLYLPSFLNIPAPRFAIR
mgnify:CR=1 FL=1